MHSFRLLMVAIAASGGMLTRTAFAEEKTPEVESSAADANILQLQMQLREARARAYFQEAQSLIEKDQVGPSFAYLLRAARVNPSDRTPLQRLVGLTLYRTLPSVYGQTRHAQEALDARFRLDGEAFVSVGMDGSVQFCDLKTSQSRSLTPHLAAPVLSVAMSPRQFAAGAADGSVQRWNAATGEAIGTPVKLSMSVVQLTYAKDSAVIAAGLSDGTIQLIDAESGNLGAKINLGESITALAFLPGDRIMAISGQKLHLRAANTLAESAPALDLESAPSAWALSREGTRLATASQRATTVWDLPGRRKMSGPFEQPGSVLAMDFDHGGDRLAIGDSGGTAMVWDAVRGKVLNGPMDHLSAVVRVRFDPKGLRLATGTFRGNAAIWSTLRTERLTVRMNYGGSLTSLDWSPNGHYLLAASSDQTARAWDVRSGVAQSEPLPTAGGVAHVGFLSDREIALIPTDDPKVFTLREILSGKILGPEIQLESPLIQAAFSPNGERLALACEAEGGLKLRLYAARTGQAVGAPFQIPGAATRLGIVFSADGRYAMIPSGQELMVCDTETGRPVPLPMKLPAPVATACFSPDGRLIFAGGDDGAGRIWHLPGGDPVTGLLRHTGRILTSTFSPDGSLLATGSADATAALWKTANGSAVCPPLGHETSVQAVRFSADGQSLATGTAAGHARLFSPIDGQPRTESLPNGAPVWDLTFAPSGQWLEARFGIDPADRQLRIWNLATKKPYILPPGMLNSVAVDPKDHRMVAAYAHGKAYVFSALTGKMAGAQLTHEGSIADAVFSSDGRQVATGSWDSTARVWDVATRTPLSDPLEHTGPVSELRLSADGQRLVTIEADALVRVWELGPFNQSPPQWFDDLISVESGFSIDADGQLEPYLSDRIQTRLRIEKLITGDSQDPWIRWGQWMFADLIDSPISPNATIFVRAHLENRIATADTLELLDTLAVRCAGDDKLQQVVNARRDALQLPVK